MCVRAVAQTGKPTDTETETETEHRSLRRAVSGALPQLQAAGDWNYKYDALSAPEQSGAKSSDSERSAVSWLVRIFIRMARG